MNPRASCPTYTLSRGASSPLEYFSKVKMCSYYSLLRGGLSLNPPPVKSLAERVGFEPTWACTQTVFKTASLWPLRYLSINTEPRMLPYSPIVFRGSASLCPACGTRKFAAFPQETCNLPTAAHYNPRFFRHRRRSVCTPLRYLSMNTEP